MAPSNQASDKLASHLAELEERFERTAEKASDNTDSQLMAEFDDLARSLRQGPQRGEFEDESGCTRATRLVQELGQDPQAVASALAAGDAQADDPADLGTLGQYELLAKVGEGGMGAVYLARHTRLDKIVAVKVLPPDRMRDADAVARFDREMRAVGKLEHPNIVRAMDAGEVDGTHFLAMEYVKGIDLSQLSKKLGPLPIAEACEMIRQAALGLDEAFEHRMVHRDIKPGNLILAAQGRKPPIVKILDMGLAMLAGRNDIRVTEGLTNTGTVMGTLDYMAPEQVNDSKYVDIRADIYSLGASLFRLLTGQAVYSAYPTPLQKMAALATVPAPPIRTLRAEVPAELEEVVRRLLEHRPEGRYQTPEEVALALAPFSKGANLKQLLEDAAALDAPVSDQFESPTTPDAEGVEDTEVSSTKDPKESPVPTPEAVPVPLPVVATDGNEMSPRLAAALGAGALGIVALVAAVLFFFQTPQGVLRVEINDPEIEVRVKGTDVIIDGADKEEIRLAVGEQNLLVKRGDFEFETNKFELKRNQVTTVKVELLDGEIKVVAGDAVLDSAPLPANKTSVAGAADTRPRRPLASTPREDIEWAVGLNAKVVLRIGTNQELTIQTAEEIPTEPATLVGLMIDGEINDDTLKRVTTFSHLELIAAGKHCGDCTAAGVRQLTSLVGLKTFAMRYLSPDAAQASDVLASFPSLITLVLPYNDADTWAQQAAKLASLQRVVAYRTTLSDDGLGHFAGKESLMFLEAHESSVTEQGIKRFAKQTPWCQVVWDGGTIHPSVRAPDSGEVNTGYALQLHGGSASDQTFVGPKDTIKLPWGFAADQNFTVEFWLRAKAFTGQKPFQALPYALEVGHGTSFLTFHVGNERKHAPGGPVDQWVHLACVVEGNELRHYVGGKLTGSVEIPQREQMPERALLGRGTTGEMDEVRISTNARYQENFTPQTRFTPDSDTFALYHFDEGSGLLVHDYSGNRHHGMIALYDATPAAVWTKSDGPTGLSQKSENVATSSQQTPDNTDRAIAEWVLSRGGKICLEGFQGGAISLPRHWISDQENLPETIEQLKGVMFFTVPLSDEDLSQLAGAGSLEMLALMKTNVTGSGLAHLEKAPLKFLQLSHPNPGRKLSTEGVEAIAACQQLEVLMLDLQPAAARQLDKLLKLQRLRSINLYATGLDDAGAMKLLDFPELKWVNPGTGISEETWQQMITKRPGLTLP